MEAASTPRHLSSRVQDSRRLGTRVLSDVIPPTHPYQVYKQATDQSLTPSRFGKYPRVNARNPSFFRMVKNALSMPWFISPVFLSASRVFKTWKKIQHEDRKTSTQRGAPEHHAHNGALHAQKGISLFESRKPIFGADLRTSAFSQKS